MSSTQTVSLSVNGEDISCAIEPRRNLVDFLREDLQLTGTHVGCEHGVCGACTLLFNGEAVRSCIMLAVQADGATLTTVEGLAKGDELHPLQLAFQENHALQCGFCTPGFLMTAYSYLQDNPEPTEGEIRKAISGNICRCTGYQPIIAAILEASRR